MQPFELGIDDVSTAYFDAPVAPPPTCRYFEGSTALVPLYTKLPPGGDGNARGESSSSGAGKRKLEGGDRDDAGRREVSDDEVDEESESPGCADVAGAQPRLHAAFRAAASPGCVFMVWGASAEC